MANNTTTKITISINGKEVEHTLKGLRKELSITKQELNDLNASDPNFKKKQAELQAHLKATQKEYDNVKTSIYGVNNATEKYSKNLSSTGDIAKGVAAGMVAAFSVDRIVQYAQQIYLVSEQMRKLNTQVSQLTNLSGFELQTATIDTQSIADVYGKDSNEVMRSANAMKVLSGSYAESIEFIKQGFKEGVDISGEMLDNIREYSPFIKEAGGDAQDLMNILKAGTIDGVFNDKAIDAVKEFTIRVREMTPATKAAFDQLGISSSEVVQQINSGQVSIIDVMNRVSKRMSEFSADSQAVGVAMADIWGGPGEDAGYEFLSTLYKVGDAQKVLTKEQQENLRITEKQLEASNAWNTVWLSLTGTAGGFTEALADAQKLGADFLSWIFDIKAASPADDIMNEAISVKMLENELFRSNTTAERRNQILNELKGIYPDIFENLDLEKATNIELKKAIDDVSDSLMKRYAIQQQQDVFDEISKSAAKTLNDIILTEPQVDQLLSKILIKEKIEIPVEIQTKSVLEQAEWLRKELSKKATQGSYENVLGGAVSNLKSLTIETENWNKELSVAEKNLKTIQNRLFNSEKLSVEEYRSYFESYTKKQLEAWNSARINKNLSGLTPPKKTGESDAQKTAKKEAADVKREAEKLYNDLLKAREDYLKKLNDAQRNNQQEQIDLLKNGIEKELEQVRFNTDSKILVVEDEINKLLNLQKEYQKKATELDALATKTKIPADREKYKKEAEEFRKLADEQIKIINYKNSTIIALSQKATFDELTVFSKYKAKEIELRQKSNDDLFNEIKIQQNEELAQATTLEEAKKILQEKYGVENLNHIRTLTDARNELTKEQNKVMLQEQLGALEIELAEIQKLLNDDAFSRENGLQILTDEDRDKQIENLKKLGYAISEVKVAISGEEALTEEEKEQRNGEARSQMLSGLDLLGFSAEDWETAFEGLDSAIPGLEKMAAAINLVDMALQTAGNAWRMFADAQNAAMDRKLKKFEANTNKEKDALKKQLDQGYISQESYNAQIEKLETELAAKRSEIDYKKATSEWKANLLSAHVNTALGVTKAVAASPTTGGLPFSAIVAAIGTAQQIIIAANKPDRGSYAVGGHTEGLGYTDETGEEVAGTVHEGEYVVAKWMKKIPLIANMVEFMETVRTGGNPTSSDSNNYAEGGNVTNSNSNDRSDFSILFSQLSDYIQRGNEIFEQLLIHGVRVPMTMETAKQFSELNNNYQSLMNKRKK